MATHDNSVTLRSIWRRGWALMWAGRTSDGYELLCGLKLSDLKWIADPERPERLVVRVQSVVERESTTDADADQTVMEVLIRAAKKGDREARDLLLFGDLELPPQKILGPSTR
jgi:hypothetical protein